MTEHARVDTAPEVSGFVAPGFEPVAEEIVAAAIAAGEDGVAVAATIEGETVLDVWWGDADGGPWQADTLCCVYSCTKGLAALCAHILADRGMLDVDAPVVQYWPEYGANGKGETLVRHVLNHSAGVLMIPRYWEVLPPGPAGLADSLAVAEQIAAAPPSWEPGSAAGYHALTFGWILGEIIRRVDGRNIGTFFAEDVAGPLGIEAFIGAPDDVLDRVTSTRMPAPGNESPEEAAAAKAQSDAMVAAAWEQLRSGDLAGAEGLWLGSMFTPPDEDPTQWVVRVMNDPVIRRAEIAAGNGIASARALAGMYAPLANEGLTSGRQLVSNESIGRFSTPQPLADGTATGYGLGYAVYSQGFGVPRIDDGGRHPFGHSGAGGNLALADPAYRLSYAYVKNRMVYDPDASSRPLRALYRLL